MQQVCTALWERLSPRYMKMPQTPEEWKLIANDFNDKMDFPHCVGSVDGKHIVMKAPWNSGSLYYNYKGSYSIVLMALVDANYKFLYVDIGAYGSQSDGGIFKNCKLGKALKSNELNLPKNEEIEGAEDIGKMPYVILGDEAFPLQTNLMRPFPGKTCNEDQTIYNFRLSRARRIVENAFGILAARWRVFHSKIAVTPELCEDVIKATCCLHNMLQQHSNPVQIAGLLQDSIDDPSKCMLALQKAGLRGGKDASNIRDQFTKYFVEYNPLDWQLQYVRRGQF